MTVKSLDLCISIVSGGEPQVSYDCVKSVARSLSGNLRTEIHFIDNASQSDLFDSIESETPLLTLHRNQTRKGFAANHNSVISSVQARYYLLLNDDTIVHENCCERLVNAADRFPRAGFLGAKLFNPDGTIQPSAYRFPSPARILVDVLQLNRLLKSVPFFDDYGSFEYDAVRSVDFLSGAALLARRTMLDEIGLLDEDFFMYSEETDWCMRAKNAGWLTMFVPDAHVMHYGGLSTAEARPERSVEFLRSHERLVRKHFGEQGLLSFRTLNLLKHAPRAILATLAGWPEHRRQCEVDLVLWSIGALKRPGLSELARGTNALSKRS
jgi:GT2 family glycosyltransferase